MKISNEWKANPSNFIKVIVHNEEDAKLVLNNLRSIWVKSYENSYEGIDFLQTNYIENDDFSVDLEYNIRTNFLEFADTQFSMSAKIKEMPVSEFINYLKSNNIPF